MNKKLLQALAISAGALATTAVSFQQPVSVNPDIKEPPMGRPMRPMDGRMRGPGPRGHHGRPGYHHMQMLRDRIAIEQNPTIKAQAEDLLTKIELGDKNIEALWTIRHENMQKLHQLLGLPEMGQGQRGPGRYGKGGRGGRGHRPGYGYGYGKGGSRMMDK